MEHRLSRRQPLQVDATIRLGDGLSFEAVTANVSTYGALLNPVDGVRTNAFVHVTLRPESGCMHPTIRGVVVHSSARGVGIMFANACDVEALSRTKRAA